MLTLAIIVAALALPERSANERNRESPPPAVPGAAVRLPAVRDEVQADAGDSDDSRQALLPAAPAVDAAAAGEPTAIASPVPPKIDQAAAEYALSIPAPMPVGAPTFNLRATHYGISYQGLPMGCPPVTMPAGRPWGNRYETSDPQIVAAGAALAAVAPCGTLLEVCGPAGCIMAYRLDSCPGCDQYGMIDLSEAGIVAVCGSQGSCSVTVKVGP